ERVERAVRGGRGEGAGGDRDTVHRLRLDVEAVQVRQYGVEDVAEHPARARGDPLPQEVEAPREMPGDVDGDGADRGEDRVREAREEHGEGGDDGELDEDQRDRR